MSRIVVPGLPHHVTQRGNRGERVFFEDGDYAGYGDSFSIPNLPNTVAHPSFRLSGGRRARSAVHHRSTLSALTYFSPWAAATGSQVTLPSWTLSPARRCGSS
jgi:hypothetical protein